MLIYKCLCLCLFIKGGGSKKKGGRERKGMGDKRKNNRKKFPKLL